MNDRIAVGLASQFEDHRIVFWYDPERSFREAFDALALPEVQKVELADNEFGVKHRILRSEPKQKFLLYKHGSEPAPLENWLLDVQLGNAVFRTDQTAIWLSELGLGMAFGDVVSAHREFFGAQKRVDQLKKVLLPDDTKGLLRLKMLSVCAGSDPSCDAVMEALLAEHAAGKDDRLRLIVRSGLDGFLWEQLQRQFAYRSDDPGIEDFSLELFKSCYAAAVGGNAKLKSEAVVFFRRWKNNRSAGEAFELLSEDYADVLDIKSDLAKHDFRTLMEVDYFREIDRAIIRNLVSELTNQTSPYADVIGWVRQRRQSHWYAEFRTHYQALESAAEFLQLVTQLDLTMDSLSDGVRRYAQRWFRIDQLYRQFVFNKKQSMQSSLLGELTDKIENLYSNSYLLKLNDAWQSHVDKVERWEAFPAIRQREFYATQVAPFRRKELKLCVIISDALRYEIGEELLTRVRSINRHEAGIEAALASLPSYTQLGMASLLPNKSIAIADNDSGTVLVDGLTSQGTQNRLKVLGASGRTDDRVHALKAEELIAMNRDEARALLRDIDVLYVYHNRIDATGDKAVSEDRVFEAVEDTLDELVKLIQKLTGANASNILVTADHGFIYQNRPIAESDYSTAEVSGETILFRDRRFVLGKGLKEHPGLRRFDAASLGLEGDVEVLIPKSINRLRLKGSGSRYVHGGASLQEVVVPVLTINMKRQSDVSVVDVDIIASTSKTISSSQLSVLFYQTAPVSDKTQPRRLRAGIYSASGALISDQHELLFDYRSGNAREREVSVRFLLSKQADDFNNQDVTLRLEEQHSGTSHYKDYRSAVYRLRRQFGSDFDF